MSYNREQIYDKVNQCETFEELAQVIEMLVDEDGFIQGRNRKFNGKAMADYCRNFSIVYPNILTREFGIRQQAMYINYYNNLSNKIGIPGGEINN